MSGVALVGEVEVSAAFSEVVVAVAALAAFSEVVVAVAALSVRGSA